ncbi:MAG: hypothetical protein KGL63_12985 [Betaproteobacteria bacterium]|nr:hypothetical protein [Betaproteobacteria bacterium]MDE2344278.1 hypothetical protein [Betaproteobacteria bacterium]
MKVFLRRAWSQSIRDSALQVAGAVGLLLNLVNQGWALMHLSGISWQLLAMNFIVPYCVATYSAVKNAQIMPVRNNSGSEMASLSGNSAGSDQHASGWHPSQVDASLGASPTTFIHRAPKGGNMTIRETEPCITHPSRPSATARPCAFRSGPNQKPPQSILKTQHPL